MESKKQTESMSNKVNNSLKVTDYISSSQLKKRVKLYLSDTGYSEFIAGVFPEGLVISLVSILEELLSDCLKDIKKHDITGLYPITELILKNTINSTDKYDFILRHLKKYNSIIKYADSIFFNIRKVFDNLESKYGSKLMIESEARNLITFILLSLQYDLLNLALRITKYSNKRTLNKNVLITVIEYNLTPELSSKIKLKLDSSNVTTAVEVEDTTENSDLQEDDEEEEDEEEDEEEEN